MLGTYNRMFFELLGSQQDHANNWHIFWLGDTSESTIDTVRNIRQRQNLMWQQTEQDIHAETQYTEQQVAWMQSIMVERLRKAVEEAPATNEHFMHHALNAVFVGYLGVFTDINQLAFRHMMAWMAYQVWYLQESHDMVHMPSRTLGQSFDRMVELASADANNSQDEWLNTYAPDGMSRRTQREEVEAQAGEQDSSSEDEAEEECPYCSGEGGGGHCICAARARQNSHHIQAQINGAGGASQGQMQQLERNGAAQSRAGDEEAEEDMDTDYWEEAEEEFYDDETEPFSGNDD